MTYLRFADDDGNEHGSFEVFWHDGSNDMQDDDGEPLPEGFYWWACFPGCMPDGDPMGPFETEQEAIDDAQEGA